MAEMVINSNQNWELNDTSEKILYAKTLKTADNFVDRDIEVKIKAKDGAVTVDNKTITINPVINYVTSTDKYAVTVNGNTTVKPNVAEGWVSSADSGIIYVNGTLNLDTTKMNAELVADSTQTSGYSVYRTTASKGYNDTVLTSEVVVYQGDYL